MRKRYLWLLASSLLVISLLLSSCAETAEEEEEEEVVGEHWWDKFGEPEYGGILNVYTFRAPALKFDPFMAFMSNNILYEDLFAWDWKTDRDEWSFSTSFVPTRYYQGWYMESVDWPDEQTMVIKIREGIHWHDKPPLNGRELVADDIVHHYHRMGGIGSGYTQASPFISPTEVARWDEIKATDDHTVVFTFKEPSIVLNYWSVTGNQQGVEPPELAQIEGGLEDWEKAIGTGAFLIDSVIADTSMTMTKNPDYWGYDERHPKNKLPYVDTYKQIYIADMTTAIAALRTGKIDYMDGLDHLQGKTLEQTAPEIIQGIIPQNGWSIDIRCDTPPFDDINVRKALQMAIDRPTIAKSYYGGTSPEEPCGVTNPIMTGYALPYAQWPAELKEEYSYNPERARELLAEAGYPNGFETNCITASGGGPHYDKEILEIAKSYFKEIGVNVEIRVMEYSTQQAFIKDFKHDALVQTFFCGVMYPPGGALDLSYSKGSRNFTKNNDAHFDSLVDRFNKVTTEEEAQMVAQEADLYTLENHWRIVFPLRIRINPFQPYLKGYSNEFLLDRFMAARLWIDSEKKESMGY